MSKVEELLSNAKLAEIIGGKSGEIMNKKEEKKPSKAVIIFVSDAGYILLSWFFDSTISLLSGL